MEPSPDPWEEDSVIPGAFKSPLPSEGLGRGSSKRSVPRSSHLPQFRDSFFKPAPAWMRPSWLFSPLPPPADQPPWLEYGTVFPESFTEASHE